MTEYTCAVCHTKFIPISKRHYTCSKKCSNINHTRTRYTRESNNWYLYFKNIISKKEDRKANLTPEILIELLNKQKHKCALSGVKMTCIRIHGLKIKTNASIDRIDPKGEYNIGNIQIVCSVLNKFREDTDLEEFINWCKKVARYNGIRKQTKTL